MNKKGVGCFLSHRWQGLVYVPSDNHFRKCLRCGKWEMVVGSLRGYWGWEESNPPPPDICSLLIPAAEYWRIEGERAERQKWDNMRKCQ